MMPHEVVEGRDSPIIRSIKRKIAHKGNMIIVFVGDPGSGKSIASLSLAMKLDPKFDVKKQVVFNGKQFVDLFDSNTLKPGQVIMWDESTIEGMDNRKWFSLLNETVSKTLQTARYRRIITLFNSPSLSFFDSKVRALLHAAVEMQSINFDNKTSSAKWFNLSTNKRSGKVYNVYPSIKIGRAWKRCSRVHFNLPPKDALDEYEHMKDEFCKKLYSDLSNKLTDYYSEEKEKKDTPTIIAEVLSNAKDYMNAKGTIVPALIMAEYDIGRSKATTIKQAVEVKLESALAKTSKSL